MQRKHRIFRLLEISCMIPQYIKCKHIYFFLATRRRNTFDYEKTKRKTQQRSKGHIHSKPSYDIHLYIERVFSHQNDKSIRWQQLRCFSFDCKWWHWFQSPPIFVEMVCNAPNGINITIMKMRNIRWICRKNKFRCRYSASTKE